MTKKPRSDTTAGKVAAMRATTVAITPPQHLALHGSALPFWQSIILAKTCDEWTAADLEQAVILARCRADIFRLQAEVDSEGDIIEGRLNPKHVLLETLCRRNITLSRQLQIHARAIAGERRDQQPHRRLASDTRAALADWDDDGLLARPE